MCIMGFWHPVPIYAVHPLISSIDLLRDCKPPRTCKIDLGKTENHLYSKDMKNVTLILGDQHLSVFNILIQFGSKLFTPKK